jgi:hypothetical protein
MVVYGCANFKKDELTGGLGSLTDDTFALIGKNATKRFKKIMRQYRSARQYRVKFDHGDHGHFQYRGFSGKI